MNACHLLNGGHAHVDGDLNTRFGPWYAPVLLEQSTSVPAISSTADMRATMAPSLASLYAPSARVTLSTVGMAMGMPPTMMTSMLVSVGQPSLPRWHTWRYLPNCTASSMVHQTPMVIRQVPPILVMICGHSAQHS